MTAALKGQNSTSTKFRAMSLTDRKIFSVLSLLWFREGEDFIFFVFICVLQLSIKVGVVRIKVCMIRLVKERKF